MTKNEQVVYAYVELGCCLVEIVNALQINKSEVCKILAQNHVQTSPKIWMQCETCGAMHWKRRGYRARHFCSDACYFQSRRTRTYVEHRQGQRHARAVVSKYFKIPPRAVVHHEDGNNDNNEPWNLMVFASQSDHMAYHHGVKKVIPLWDGRKLLRKKGTAGPKGDVYYLVNRNRIIGL